ncbi:hypothetical protein CHS0354_020122 [Potamilus streckersoni]|uniref:BHLH domain-containing protein n=1 Tax=Potamilus streckersoni TaxID=2493646 RepID=A0AAE0S598_9BIVA|nr:hypothetical protein CHS0354_020122 [Potamilus streckersoni]
MPRTVMRARRRQSDAKWRASVAMCYDIMKNVIPDHKKLSRRKVSKALILKETERHIERLENRLKELLEVTASHRGKRVLLKKEENVYTAATFINIQEEFAIRQQQFFTSNGSGKKRYNVPADIEASMLTISQQISPIVVAEVAGDNSAWTKSENSNNRDKYEEKASNQELRGRSGKLETLLTSFSSPVFAASFEPKVSLTGHKDPQKNNGSCIPSLCTPTKPKQPRRRKMTCTSKCTSVTPVKLPAKRTDLLVLHTDVTPVKTPKLPSSENKSQLKNTCEMVTPSKIPPEVLFNRSSPGFTPVKLPHDLEVDSLLSLPSTPAKSLIGSPFSCFSSLSRTPGSSCVKVRDYLEMTDDETETKSLLCTETIDTMDLEDDGIVPCEKDRIKDVFLAGSATDVIKSEISSNRKSRNSKSRCRRRLEGSFPADQGELSPELSPPGQFLNNSDDSCLDFDGYFLFYQHQRQSSILDESETPFVSEENLRDVTHMWENMATEYRQVYKTIACMKNSSEDSLDLAEDLKEIDLKPLDAASNKKDPSGFANEEDNDTELVAPSSHKVSDLLDGFEVPDIQIQDHPQRQKDFQLVPEYADLGIIVVSNESSDEEEQEAEKKYPVQQSHEGFLEHNNQVVPDVLTRSSAFTFTF